MHYFIVQSLVLDCNTGTTRTMLDTKTARWERFQKTNTTRNGEVCLVKAETQCFYLGVHTNSTIVLHIKDTIMEYSVMLFYRCRVFSNIQQSASIMFNCYQAPVGCNFTRRTNASALLYRTSRMCALSKCLDNNKGSILLIAHYQECYSFPSPYCKYSATSACHYG